jgi:hypothetical protein
MSTDDILTTIDAEIRKLQRMRDFAVLVLTDEATEDGRPGRPVSTGATANRKRKSGLTPEGRKRIAAAVKARWAAQKNKAAK